MVSRSSQQGDSIGRNKRAAAKSLQIRARTKAEQEVLQAAVNGANPGYFRAISSSLASSDDDDYNWWLNVYDLAHGCSVIHWAAGMGHLSLVQFLLSEYKGIQNVDQQAQGNSQGRTALHYACRNGHIEIARYLVEEHGANVNPVEAHHGVTPFHLVSYSSPAEPNPFEISSCISCMYSSFRCVGISGRVEKSFEHL